MQTAVKFLGKTKSGQEIWHVNSDGRIKRLVTGKASIQAMDEAVLVYGRALKSLAQR